ncbi:MAG: GntR family transcriptional regulator [Acidobacteria bacterium]|nr:GntR family transcriptional regulator [Acidobacteriota bacterium]
MPGLTAKPENLRAKAYQHIRTKLFSGEVAPGEILSEENLSSEIGISRTPVREAMGQLVAEGFLDREAGRGTSVRRLSRADVVELFELREALEAYAVGKVATYGLREAEAARLDHLCARIQELAGELERRGGTLDKERMERFLALDLQFHAWLLRAAGNRRILKVVYDARLFIRIFTMPHEGHTVEELHRIYDDHRGILAACLAADAARAVQLCQAHIQRSARERLEKFDRWERVSQIRLDEMEEPTL